MNKTDSWICDSCGQKIKNQKDGWVEWLTYKDTDGRFKYKENTLRIVHNAPSSPNGMGKCQYNENYVFSKYGATVSDTDLEDLQGSDGLMELLRWIADEEMPQEEILEIVKRIHIPGYELARSHFDDAIGEGVFEPNTKEGYYWQSDIKAVLNHFKLNI